MKIVFNLVNMEPDYNNIKIIRELVGSSLADLNSKILEIELKKYDSQYVYFEQEALAALKIFVHVVYNIKAHSMLDKGRSLEQMAEMRKIVDVKIIDIFKECTGIDLTNLDS